MKLIYVAGRYRAATPEGVRLNIEAARAMGVLVAELGIYPVIPHANTAGFENFLASGHDTLARDGSNLWLSGSLELMRKCDGVILVPGGSRSVGTRAEVDEALRIGLPIFYSIAELSQHLQECI